MNSFLSLFTDLKKDDFTLFFEKEITNPNSVLDEDRLRQFKILILKNPNKKPDEMFFKAISQQEGLHLSRVLIFFFIYINWLSVKEIELLYRNIVSNNILQLKEKTYFEDKQDSHFYHFNQLFSQYIHDYMRDIDNIYTLKNKNLDAKKYAKLILEEEIAYEGLYFFLLRTNLSFALFENFNWILTEKTEHTGFKYAAEVVSRQLVEEYMFVRNVFRELLYNDKVLINSMRGAEFLFLYEIIMWKEKRMKEVHRKFDWFFNSNLIKFPVAFTIEPEQEKFLNEALLEYQTHKNEIKFLYQSKNSCDTFNKKSLEYFKTLVPEDDQSDSTHKLFARHSILDRLGSANLILSQSQL